MRNLENIIGKYVVFENHMCEIQVFNPKMRNEEFVPRTLYYLEDMDCVVPFRGYATKEEAQENPGIYINVYDPSNRLLVRPLTGRFKQLEYDVDYLLNHSQSLSITDLISSIEIDEDESDGIRQSFNPNYCVPAFGPENDALTKAVKLAIGKKHINLDDYSERCCEISGTKNAHNFWGLITKSPSKEDITIKKAKTLLEIFQLEMEIVIKDAPVSKHPMGESISTENIDEQIEKYLEEEGNQNYLEDEE